MGIIYDEEGHYDQAMDYCQKALDIRLKILGEVHPDVANSYQSIGGIYHSKRDYNQALNYHHKAAKIRLEALGEPHPNMEKIYNNIGTVYLDKGDYDQALKYHQKTLDICKTRHATHPNMALYYQYIGLTYQKKGDPGRALEYYQKAIIVLVADFEDENLQQNPMLEKVSNKIYLLGSLALKAKTLEYLYRKQSQDPKDLRLSVSTYRLAARLIKQIKSSYKTKKSKLLFAEKIQEIYTGAIRTTLELHLITPEDSILQQAI